DLFNLVCERSNFSRKDARSYAAELLIAIEAIHKLRVIHRDLKPENVMIGMDGHLILADFGLVWQLKEGGDYPASRVGTPEYRTPEVLLERHYELEADLWSLTVILYDMLSCKVSKTLNPAYDLHNFSSSYINSCRLRS
ncbi:kinase-like domain-containing protein, partial [Russula compacta]